MSSDHKERWVGPPQFTTTHWSLVLSVGRSNSTQAQAALEQLCRIYWYPLYAYARRRGFDVHHAEDLVQGFFAALIERDMLDNVQREGGRFRSFLLTAFNRYLADEHDRDVRLKRGGGRDIVSWDAVGPEERYRMEPVDVVDPEKLFERRWAFSVLERALGQLRDELKSAGDERLFEHLQAWVMGERAEQRQAEIGARLGLSEGAVSVMVHRLRRRYRRLLHEVISETVANPADVQAELGHLLAVLRGG